MIFYKLSQVRDVVNPCKYHKFILNESYLIEIAVEISLDVFHFTSGTQSYIPFTL